MQAPSSVPNKENRVPPVPPSQGPTKENKVPPVPSFKAGRRDTPAEFGARSRRVFSSPQRLKVQPLCQLYGRFQCNFASSCRSKPP